jgi:thymidylate kinase
MAGRVILIEGMDLSGKSTLVHNLRAELTRRGIPVRVSRNALCPDNPIAALADQVRRDPQAGLVETGALFLAAHLWDARHFTPPPDGMVHIQDSCWLRTVAHHMVHGTPHIAGLLLQTSLTFPVFDAAIFLTADLDERRRRLGQREREHPGANDHADHSVIHQPNKFLLQEAIMRRLAERLMDASTINTTGVHPNALTESCLRKINCVDPCFG